MFRTVVVGLCVFAFGVAIWLSPGQTKAPDNNAPAQAAERRNPPREQAQPSTTNEVFNAASNQSPSKEEQSYGRKFVDNLFTDPIVWLTIALAWLAWVQLQVYRAEVTDTRSIERCYVWIKHYAPGFDDTGRVSVRVINTGNTPGTITDVSIWTVPYDNMAAVPDFPRYEWSMGNKQGAGSRAFLVKDEFITIAFRARPSDFAVAKQDPTKVLAVVGFIDYIDKFGVRHRNGYGRFYQADRDNRASYTSDESYANRVNMGYLPKPGYNYDRPRQPGEGTDWG